MRLSRALWVAFVSAALMLPPAARAEGTAADIEPLKALARREAAEGNAGARALLDTLDHPVGDDVVLAANRWILDAAKRGHAQAQFQVGVQLDMGAEPRPDVAAEWYRKAAEQGFALAQSNLAALYLKGRGVPQDAGQAVEWSLKAARQGNAASQARLGALYWKGEGVPKDARRAVQWLDLAARQGHAGAQSQLGIMFAFGEGVPRNSSKGLFWLRKAAAQGEPMAKLMLPKAEAMPPDSGTQLALDATKLMADAEKGDVRAQVEVGERYLTGKGFPRDDEQALRYFRMAAGQGNARAQAMLGDMYRTGRGGVARDDVEAVRLYKLSAEQGDRVGQVMLARMYEQGRGGLPKDPAVAQDLMRKAGAREFKANVRGRQP